MQRARNSCADSRGKTTSTMASNDKERRALRLAARRCVRTCVGLAVGLAMVGSVASAGAGPVRSAESWLVRAGKDFQRAGEYNVRRQNTHLQDASDAYGEPSNCRVIDPAHVVATWADRGIWIDAWTYGGMPAGEDGCVSPELIYVSEIRLTGNRWTTSLGLRVGDPTAKLRRLYRRAQFHRVPRSAYWLVTRHGPCVGVCTQQEQRNGVDYPRLTAQVRGNRVAALWVPVFGQGE
jgi:hypothetical protein